MFSKKSPVRVLLWVALAAVGIGLLAWSGCSKGGDNAADNDVVLAHVGDADIMASEYTHRLAKQEMADLPKGDDGQPLDMSSLEGKNAFLQTLINKELMRQKAIQLGYVKDAKVSSAHQSLLDYHAGMSLWDDVVGEPSKTISDEELADFYAKMGSNRKCHYIITNFIEDAEAARKMAQDGADWDDVAVKYHDGDSPQGGEFLIEVPFGRYGTAFEGPVYAVEVGEVTEPIQTVYGYWILRVDEETHLKADKKPDLEEAKAQILDTTYSRKVAKIRNDFRKEVREKYKLTIHEDALWKCYQGLPSGELILDPVTQKPTPKEDLNPLNIKPADMDMPFYSYQVGDEVTAYTLGDYKVIFDRMSVFQRPKQSDMLGSLRNKIQQELEKALMNIEAKSRHYEDDPRVTSLVDEKMEEILVTKLYQDLVTYDKRITPEQLDAYWAEHHEDYAVPETRSGHMVVCLNEADAIKAREAIASGTPWKKVLVEYGSDRGNKSKGGRLEDIPATATGFVRDALFAMEMDGLSDPVALEQGRFCVLNCETITPAQPAVLKGITETVGKRMKKEREEAAFQTLLDQWTAEFGVEVFEDNLSGLPSWEELVNPPLPDNMVPRNT